MTDAEILKALEGCSNWESDKTCDECPANTYGFGCAHKMAKHTLDLINHQKAEVERLQKKVDYLKDADNRKDAHFHVRLVEQAKSEARKEFVKKFEKKIKDVNFTLGQTWEIQCALKEVLEELESE